NTNKNQASRSPIIVVMGHVDHGKTSLLDYIRKTSLVEKEAGGITQSIGAYEVEVRSGGEPKSREIEANRGAPRQAREDFAGRKITFIDTPGHEAFSKMRSRGAHTADLAILVVASDEGVKPQTKEAIKILKDTETPYIVAITKIDRKNANIEKVKNELLSEGVLLEGLGGDVSWQGVSVETGEGIEDLLGLILLLAEIENLTYDSKAPGRGVIIESHKDSRKGIIANCVLRDGILKIGDPIATASSKGKIKILEDFMGKKLKEVRPSSPVSIMGFESIPSVGEEFWIGEGSAPVKSGQDLFAKAAEGEMRLRAILKASNSGSLEVLKSVLENQVFTVNSSVGDVTSNDIQEAINTGSVIVNFNSKMDKSALNLADVHKIKIFKSAIIYKLVEEIEAYLKGEAETEPIGSLEILKVFEEKGRRRVIGGRVVGGVIKNNADIQIERNGNIVGEGRVINIQSQKKDVAQIEEGECGMLIETEARISSGDTLKAF
ncbi:MAG TPA: translation initiation factor IF-2, partial [Candidatus Paceibacterota bacterium]